MAEGGRSNVASGWRGFGGGIGEVNCVRWEVERASWDIRWKAGLDAGRGTSKVGLEFLRWDVENGGGLRARAFLML